MAFISDKFKELERRRKSRKNWNTIVAEVFGYDPRQIENDQINEYVERTSKERDQRLDKMIREHLDSEGKPIQKPSPTEQSRGILDSELERMVEDVLIIVGHDTEILTRYLQNAVLIDNDRPVLDKYSGLYNMVEYFLNDDVKGCACLKALSSMYVDYMKKNFNDITNEKKRTQVVKELKTLKEHKTITQSMIRSRLFREEHMWDNDVYGIIPKNFKSAKKLVDNRYQQRRNYRILKTHQDLLKGVYPEGLLIDLNDRKPHAQEARNAFFLYRQYGFMKIEEFFGEMSNVWFGFTPFGKEVLSHNQLDTYIEKLKPGNLAWI
jgi:hypothetical protein